MQIDDKNWTIDKTQNIELELLDEQDYWENELLARVYEDKVYLEHWLSNRF